LTLPSIVFEELSRGRCDYEASAFSEADPGGACSFEVGPHDDLIAIVQELPLFSGRESDRRGGVWCRVAQVVP